MELLEIITLSFTVYEIIIFCIVFLTAVFGTPAAILMTNKKKIEAKADKKELVVVKNEISSIGKEVEKKASYTYVEDNVKELNGIIRDHVKSNDDQFLALRGELSVVNTNILKVLTEVKRP